MKFGMWHPYTPQMVRGLASAARAQGLALCMPENSELAVYQRTYSTLSPVSTWMGDRLREGIPPWYVTSHSGQLSLAIPPWVGAMSTGDGFGHH